MRVSERILYHQIHPFKLSVDVLSAAVSVVLIWDGHWIEALLVGFLPSIAVSLYMIARMDFDRQKESAFGRYFARSTSKSMDTVRLLGYLVMLAGGWYREYWLIAAGFVVICFAWIKGLANRRPGAQRT